MSSSVPPVPGPPVEPGPGPLAERLPMARPGAANADGPPFAATQRLIQSRQKDAARAKPRWWWPFGG